ncbi:hypothetical protein LSH36_116g04011 [Paralvinella palmiformis]|uniref:Uncharacterized protein n=1 Tax=Paralvinella palmiformis TaxID=53620 RepID=A0AAD9JYA3_9ANNE|nr:hypothetical protein LSH36_116g04011 [Paralvinella palmiformis]
MDLAWRETLAERSVIHVRSKSQPSDSDHTPKPKYLGSGPAGIKYYWEGSKANRTSFANHSALYADNDFLKKSRMLTEMLSHPVKHHSFTTVLVIASIFLFFTITITIAIIVFCRKKNSVFALQKSEQEDEEGDYELDELNTDIEFTETDVESEYDNISRRKSYPLDASEDPSHRLLAAPMTHRQRLHDPFLGVHRCQCQHGHDNRGAYQTMVVAAVLEKHTASDSEDCETKLVNGKNYTPYSGDTDGESDHELLYSPQCRVMDHSGSFPYDENNYRCVYCQGSNTNNNCSRTDNQPRSSCINHFTDNVMLQSSLVEGAYDNVQTIGSNCKCMKHSNPSCLYVALPPEKDEGKVSKGKQCYVKLPSKYQNNDDDDDDDDYDDIGIDYYDLSSNSGSCVIDLHPEVASRRPNSLRLSSNSSYFNMDDNYDWPSRSYDGNDFRTSHSSMRSRSVTENLSTYASIPACPEYNMQSCPETPLMDQYGSSSQENPIGFNLAHGSGSLPYNYSTNRQIVSNMKFSDSMLNNETRITQTSSTTSIEQRTGFSFVLSSPYSSLVSLMRAPISESASQQPTTKSHTPTIAISSSSHSNLPNCCLLQEINNDIHQHDSLPSSQCNVSEQSMQMSPTEGTSATHNQAGMSCDNFTNATGQDNPDFNGEDTNTAHLNDGDS